MAGTQKQLQAMITGYISLSGSKNFFGGLDTLPANFDSLDEKEQAAAMVEAKKEGDRRKADHNKKVAKLLKEGKCLAVSAVINGSKVSGEVVWNKEGTGLMARISLPTTTIVSAEAKKKAKRSTAFAGLI
jgi:hypothetical protein